MNLGKLINMKTLKYLFTIILIINIVSGRSNQTAYLLDISKKNAQANRTKEEIIIDGYFNESGWKEAVTFSDFIQREPAEGEPASEKTSFQVMYDDRNLYVSIHAFDSEPSKIKGVLTRRDMKSPSDWVAVSIDSYNDQRTAFEFRINPLGVKYDLLRYDDVNSDTNWDPIWQAATNKDSSGWSAEIKIPLKELRFSEDNNQSWGIQVFRHISRKNEDQYWTYWPKSESGWVCHYGKLSGISSVPRQKRIYVSPYINTSSRISKDLKNEIHPGVFDNLSNVGADIKYGLTNNLTLDITINPDFGQVEADPGVFNLSAFETFLPEKRQFFIEGSNIFNYSMGIGDGGLGRNTLFYSRRIGRSPHRNLEWEIPDDTTWANSPQTTRILGAGKVTGKTEQGWSVGLLNALTNEESGSYNYINRKSDIEIVEPLTNYSVARIQKDFREGQTTFGGIFTSTLRNINDNDLNYLPDRSISGGLDFSHQFFNKRYMLDLSLTFSHVNGSRESIRNKQESSARYFQRPDAEHVSLDTNRTSMTGFANKFVIGKFGGGNWRWATGMIGNSPEFEINDLGYIQNVDQIDNFIWVGYRKFEPGKVFRSININGNSFKTYNFGGEALFSGLNINGSAQFLNYWRINFGGNYNFRGISPNVLRGGPSINTFARKSMFYGISSDDRKKVNISAFGFTYKNEDECSGFSISPKLSFRPRQNISASIGPSFRKEFDSWGWVSHETDNSGEDHFIFAELKQKLISMVVRFDWTLIPGLTIQFYGEPFFTAGEYSDYKEVVSTRAKHHSERFRPYTEAELNYYDEDEYFGVDSNSDGIEDFGFEKMDFNFKQFRSNLVVRWEYKPGSLLYLVWSQGYNHSTSIGKFDFQNDVSDLFSSNSNNVFMLKFSYLLDI